MNWIIYVLALFAINVALLTIAHDTDTRVKLSQYTPEQLIEKLEHKHVAKRTKDANHQ